LSLVEVSEASAVIQEAAHEEANIIFGAVVDPRMQGQVKITVIATGFDRAPAHRDVAASASPTPVDLSSYSARRQETTERIAAAGGGGSRMPISLNRRPTFELPLMVVNDSNGGDDPGAEFEAASPLDVPAFLRRQNE
jgi:cell division protein FtsZ